MPSLNSLTVTSNRTLVYGAQGSGGSQVQFINLSTSNTIYLGYDATLTAGQSSSNIPLGPNASITLDGLISVYALTASGTAQLAVVPGGVAYSPSTGINNLVSLGTLNGAAAFTLATGSVVASLASMIDVSAYNTITISVYGYSANMPVGGATATIPLNITWSDDLTSGIPVLQDEIDFWVANNALPPANFAGVAYITMPVRGKYLSVTTDNPGTASAITLQFFNMFGSPNITPRVYCKQIPPPSLAFVGAPPRVGNYVSTLSGILGSCTFNASPTTNYFCPMGLFTGQGNMYSLTQAAFTNDVSLFTLIPGAGTTTLPASNPANVIDDDLDSADDTDDVDAPVALPKCPTIIVLINSTAASILTNICLTAMDQA